ncbi:hypothetical protein ACP4OV_012408 [Aristida adscensionis]
MKRSLPATHTTAYTLSYTTRQYGEDYEVNEDKIEDDNEDGQIFYAFCGDRYHKNAFWIYCNVCERWFHGKCVKIKAHEADKIGNYECPECVAEKKGHDYKLDPLLHELFKRY